MVLVWLEILMRAEYEIQKLSLCDIQIDYHVLPDGRYGLPELVQFEELVNAVHLHVTGREINSRFKQDSDHSYFFH